MFEAQLNKLDDTASFTAAAQQLANDFNFDVNWLYAVIQIESNFNPWNVNPSTGAIGLIQFMPSTLDSMSLTAADIQQATATQQVNFIRQYLTPYKGRINSLNDLYMAVFYPAAIGEGLNFQLPDKVGVWNPAYQNPNGSVTVKSIMTKFQSLLPAEAQSLVNLIADNPLTSIGTVLLIGGGVLAYFYFAGKKKKTKIKIGRKKWKS